jgi:hypothetical protein
MKEIRRSLKRPRWSPRTCTRCDAWQHGLRVLLLERMSTNKRSRSFLVSIQAWNWKLRMDSICLWRLAQASCIVRGVYRSLVLATSAWQSIGGPRPRITWLESISPCVELWSRHITWQATYRPAPSRSRDSTVPAVILVWLSLRHGLQRQRPPTDPPHE